MKGLTMARALVGYVATPSQIALEIELSQLRARVRDLQAEISELRAEAAAHRVLDRDPRRSASVVLA